MPIRDFDDSTFVAFIDISGFKKMMKHKDKAWNALSKFYNYGYRALREDNSYQEENPYKVEGLFISDCGVLFVRERDPNREMNPHNDEFERLMALLKIVTKINKDMLSEDIMLTTSVAFGKFKYKNRIEFDGIDKNAIFGQAYVLAFRDNEAGEPKILPGQCRIIKRNLPGDVDRILKNTQGKPNHLFKEKGRIHYYYYWMVNKQEEIELFDRKFKQATELQFQGMLKALRGTELPSI